MWGFVGPKSSPGGRKEGRPNAPGKGEEPKKSIPFWVGGTLQRQISDPQTHIARLPSEQTPQRAK